MTRTRTLRVNRRWALALVCGVAVGLGSAGAAVAVAVQASPTGTAKVAAAKPAPSTTRPPTATTFPSSTTPSASPTTSQTSSTSTVTTTIPTPSVTSSTSFECRTPLIIDHVTYCTATEEEVIYGRYPEGTPLLLSTGVVDMWDRNVWLGALTDCPVGTWCGGQIDTGYVYFPDNPMPTWDDYFDVWGTAESSGATSSGGGGMRAVGWIKTA